MRLLLFTFTLYLLASSTAFARQLLIYHDADYTGHASSAESMAMGLKVALSELNNQIQGYELKLIAKDHRGNVKRSKLHMREFVNDPDALFVLGGLHSPPYLANLKYINENSILLMVPWAAAGPITRYQDGENWVFRVSIDDTKAGKRLSQFALDQKQCQAPSLLLENTGWGKSNHNTLSQAFANRNIDITTVNWFEWNTKSNSANLILDGIISNKADCIIFVGNAIEGEVFSRALAELPSDKRIPMISHWGITGGSFHEIYRQYLKGKIDLSFLQTCFSFNSGELKGKGKEVYDRAASLFGDVIKRPEDILAPPGFIHSYDVGKLLVAALDSITLSGDMSKDRKALKNALESITKPIEGLIKTYDSPFSTWSKNNRDAHEALDLEDFCMASFDNNGIIRLK